LKKKVIGLIDGQSGNIGSINKAIKEVIKGRPYQLKIIRGEFDYSLFNKIILPGQGAYATLISNLKKLKIYKPLKTYLENNCSYLGICVGMQILSDQGHEEKTTKGLGIIAGEIKKFKSKKLIIPHMGWNSIRLNKEDPIITNNLDNKDFIVTFFKILKNQMF
jgi:imidazole glycerol phosphate synthase glutamine amidotransferase subunit